MSYESSRAACPAHTGVTQQIREALARAPGPLSVYKIHLATGIKPDKVRSMISQMVNRTGSVVSLKGPKGIVYTLYERRPDKHRAPSTSGRRAAPITIGRGFRWGASIV